MPTLNEINALPKAHLCEQLLKCCHSHKWADSMSQRFPFSTLDNLFEAATQVWQALAQEDWREAFAAHPRSA